MAQVQPPAEPPAVPIQPQPEPPTITHPITRQMFYAYIDDIHRRLIALEKP